MQTVCMACQPMRFIELTCLINRGAVACWSGPEAPIKRDLVTYFWSSKLIWSGLIGPKWSPRSLNRWLLSVIWLWQCLDHDNVLHRLALSSDYGPWVEIWTVWTFEAGLIRIILPLFAKSFPNKTNLSGTDMYAIHMQEIDVLKLSALVSEEDQWLGSWFKGPQKSINIDL